jgi:hypothetical protein
MYEQTIGWELLHELLLGQRKHIRDKNVENMPSVHNGTTFGTAFDFRQHQPLNLTEASMKDFCDCSSL